MRRDGKESDLIYKVMIFLGRLKVLKYVKINNDGKTIHIPKIIWDKIHGCKWEDRSKKSCE